MMNSKHGVLFTENSKSSTKPMHAKSILKHSKRWKKRTFTIRIGFRSWKMCPRFWKVSDRQIFER